MTMDESGTPKKSPVLHRHIVVCRHFVPTIRLFFFVVFGVARKEKWLRQIEEANHAGGNF